MIHQVCIGVGSNIAPQENIAAAQAIIQEAFPSFRASQFVTTTPIGNTLQDDYVNGAFCVHTTWTEAQLTAWLKATEAQLGRVRTADKYGPRIIDLDVVVWDGEVRDDDFYERDFLKKAVLELLPDLQH
ncbi:MAG: 2-amino-4-hydroxy-6-hydroxymethyldihydropteridine diphosphokinase [Planctomycetes bacterium]|nr:2-amino-4-hydroxy-6-hydroxymethyldihydropteridine diphosphokinase [Planctomycetota bacterium]